MEALGLKGQAEFLEELLRRHYVGAAGLSGTVHVQLASVNSSGTTVAVLPSKVAQYHR
jgi:hypothetical protein